MKFKGPMTAAELMAKLEADPEFQKRRAEKDRRFAEHVARLRECERPILEELRRIGVEANSIEEMTRRYAPLPPPIVEVLLKWLPSAGHDRVKESVIRALGAARDPFDGQPLVDAFMRDSSETLRWPIANTMSLACPLGINAWLIEAVKNPIFGTDREMLTMALARLVPPETSRPILLSILDQLPGHVAAALAVAGGETELHALEDRIEQVDGWKKTEFRKAIRKIKSRLRKV